MVVFNMDKPGNLLRVIKGETVGTVIHDEEEALKKN
jgi:uridylate kinase